MNHSTRQQLRVASNPPLMIRVETYVGRADRMDMAYADPESLKDIDHNNSSDRKWLGTHCFWAMRNGRSVVTFPIL